MPRVAPFEALVYDTDVAGPLEDLTARPYDVISESGRRRYAARSPYNIVHLDLANDPRDDVRARHAGAGELLRRWLDTGVLRVEPTGYVVYEMKTRAGDAVRGIVCALELGRDGDRTIWPHEDVMDAPVADRLELLRSTRTHLSAIYGTVAGPHADLGEVVGAVTRTDPAGEVIDQEGVRHRTWLLPPTEPIDRWLAEDHLLIADGHHRYATALAYRDERRRAEGEGPWDRVLALVVDAGVQEVPVLPYHRLQHRGEPLPGGTPAPDRAAALAAVDDATVRIASVTMDPDGALRWMLHDLDGEPPAVRALHEAYLDRAAPGDALTFTHEVDDAVAAVRSGQAVAAYLLPATTPERIAKVVEAGGRLPRKSTFFWPKPRTGMVMMAVDRP